MVETLQKQHQHEDAIAFPQDLFYDIEQPDRALDALDAQANMARYVVAKAFSKGVRQEEILVDIARLKTKPEDFVKSVSILWGKGPNRKSREIDEMDVMQKAHALGVLDDIFAEQFDGEIAPEQEVVDEDLLEEPDEADLLEIETMDAEDDDSQPVSNTSE